MLEDFKSYDEELFAEGKNVESLENEFLLDTEKSLLQSNKIDRKTILLQHMQMYDQASIGMSYTQESAR